MENLFCVKLTKLELCFQNFLSGMWPTVGHNEFTFCLLLSLIVM